MSVDDAHKHPSWMALVTEIEQHSWIDANDKKLEKAEEEKQALRLEVAAKKAAASRRLRQPKPKRVPKKTLLKIQEYRDERAEELVRTSQAPSPPLWIRNRDHERLMLIPDVWQARETLEQGNQKASAAEVQKWLEAQGRIATNQPAGMRQRIGEAMRRVEMLITEGVWPYFDPETLPPPGGTCGNHGLHPMTVHTLIDDGS